MFAVWGETILRLYQVEKRDEVGIEAPAHVDTAAAGG
jgi:hypothetical protein